MSQIKSFLKSIISQASKYQQILRRWADIAAWRMFGTRPPLNADVADMHVGKVASGLQSDDIKGGSVHVRIVFHYAPQRLKYLIETIDAVKRWPFDEIDIWIDTNTPKLEKELKHLPAPCRISVWDDLDHPFKLTWMHRGEMRKRLEDFSAFAYIEDDIIVPPQTIRRWLIETPRLAPHGLLPGLVRVEHTREGGLVMTDHREPVSKSLIMEFDDRPYLSTPFPYQACWIYNAEQMRELNARPGYLSGTIEDPDLFKRDGPPEIRERVALGLLYVSIPDGFQSRSVVPLTDDLQISPDALVFHSPSNYGTRKPPHPAGLGTRAIENIFDAS